MTSCNPLEGNPKVTPAVNRVTITPPVIWKASNVFVLAEGAAKRDILEKILATGPIDTPPVARLLWRCTGQVRFFIDTAAQPESTRKG